MPGISLVRHVGAASPARPHVRAYEAGHEPEHVEEVWDAELVGDLPSAGWLALPALASYQRAGVAATAPRVDLRA